MERSLAYEQLGLFYLGKELDLNGSPAAGLPFLYKSKNLTTHAVIIGMTGSGKTGLGIGLIEEAIMDDVPSIIIDPKGDMANLLLAFPELGGADFAPWVDPAEAGRQGLSVEDFAARTAKTWRDGLAAWGQDGARIGTMRRKSEVTVYTPGSSNGVGVSVVAGFAAPAASILNDQDTLQALVASTATSLLSLLDIDGDPLVSREHILISSILLHHWRRQEDLSIETMIGAIVSPPFDQVGVFGLAGFFPQEERMKLALRVNNLIASPSFSAWLQGVPLDIQQMLYGGDGRPRTAIFSIAHLGEAERMFFVTLLLNALIGWMRRQQGSSSLKALLYMDEIFGYFPPTANPPAKQPMLLLLKQARAFGLGIVLATQNPVDLDYRGLANIGSWFVGRLQTAQDQDRVLEGIVGASGGTLDRTTVRRLLADLKGRRFLLTSAHLEAPLLFETRWVMSYLKGPVSLKDIGRLMEGRRLQVHAASPDPGPAAERPVGAPAPPPPLGDGVKQYYRLIPLPVDRLVFEPWLAATASVRFYSARRTIDEVREYRLRLRLDERFDEAQWADGEPFDFGFDECAETAPSGSRFLPLPPPLSALSDLRRFEKGLADYLYRQTQIDLFRAPSVKLESHPAESRTDFTVRVADRLREQKEAEAEKLLDSYRRRRSALENKRETARMRVEREKGDVSAKTADTLLSFGTAVLGAFFGRKTVSSATMTRAASGLRKAGQIGREKDDVRRAEEAASLLDEELVRLEREQSEALAALVTRYDPAAVTIETFSLKPRRSDIFNLRICLLWEMVPPPPEPS